MHFRHDFTPKFCLFLERHCHQGKILQVKTSPWLFYCCEQHSRHLWKPRACLTLKFSFLCSSIVVTTGKETCLAVVYMRAQGSAPEKCFNGLKWNRMNKDLRVAFTVQIGGKKEANEGNQQTRPNVWKEQTVWVWRCYSKQPLHSSTAFSEKKKFIKVSLQSNPPRARKLRFS